jgi:hypothetical protein
LDAVLDNQNLAIYTALFGQYDKLIEPHRKYPNCEFICFTDQKHLKSEIWDIVYIDIDGISGTYKNRRLKMLPHIYLKDYHRSLYIDANIGIDKNPFPLCSELLSKHDFIIPKHFKRTCIYEEGHILIRSNRVECVKLIKQTMRYLRSGYVSQTEMGENNVLLRNHHCIYEFSNAWWQEFSSGVSRDQFSLAYLSWKLNCPIEVRESLSTRTQMLFSIYPHQISVRPTLITQLALQLLVGIPYIITLRILKLLINK